MSDKPSPRYRTAIISAVVCVLGCGVGAIFALSYLASRYFPELSQPGVFDGLWIPVGMVILLLCLTAGMFLGSVIWLILMRFVLPREELKHYFTKPYVPLVTPFLEWIFDTLYRQR